MILKRWGISSTDTWKVYNGSCIIIPAAWRLGVGFITITMLRVSQVSFVYALDDMDTEICVRPTQCRSNDF